MRAEETLINLSTQYSGTSEYSGTLWGQSFCTRDL